MQSCLGGYRLRPAMLGCPLTTSAFKATATAVVWSAATVVRPMSGTPAGCCCPAAAPAEGGQLPQAGTSDGMPAAPGAQPHMPAAAGEHMPASMPLCCSSAEPAGAPGAVARGGASAASLPCATGSPAQLVVLHSWLPWPCTSCAGGPGSSPAWSICCCSACLARPPICSLSTARAWPSTRPPASLAPMSSPTRLLTAWRGQLAHLVLRCWLLHGRRLTALHWSAALQCRHLRLARPAGAAAGRQPLAVAAGSHCRRLSVAGGCTVARQAPD